MATIVPNGREVHFGNDEIIVSKTDLKGHITYANNVFCKVSGYSEQELLGKPHNIIRHPDMPACVFQLLWEIIKQRQEIFAYVLNMTKTGAAYWVFAHVTPSFDLSGNHIGYHSSRRSPYADALPAVKALYAKLCVEERRHQNRKHSSEAGMGLVRELLSKNDKSYGEFVFGLSAHTSLAASVGGDV